MDDHTTNEIPALPALPGILAIAQAALNGDPAAPGEILRRAILDHVRPGCAEQDAAVRAAGARQQEAAAALEAITERIQAAQGDAARVADLERAAAEAAEAAGQIHARRFAAGGGETAESRAADRKAREAAQAVAEAREAAGSALALAVSVRARCEARLRLS